MFFKFLSFLSCLAISLSLFGCGLNIGESPAPEGEVRLEGYSCVNQISQKVSSYFEGQLSEGEITGFVDCLKKSVSDFTKRVKRRPGDDIYNPEDLRVFINSISKERELTPQLLLEFMKIKKTFVGGRVDQISRSDLASALKLLEDIKRAALILRPHVKIFNSDLSSQIPADRIAVDLDRSAEALSAVTHIFLESLSNTENTYSLKDFEDFLEEFRSFINWYDVFPNGRKANDWVELIAALKKISTDGDSYQIKKNEWEPFLTFLQSNYISFLKVKYGVLDQNLWSGVGLRNLVHVVDRVRNEVIRIISSRKGRLIPMGEIESLLKSLETLGWLPFGLNADICSKGIKTFALKILEKDRTSQFLGLRNTHILALASEFEEWAETQTYISKNYLAPFKGFVSTPKIYLSNGEGEEGESKTAPLEPAGWREFKNFISKKRPLFNSKSYFVTIAYPSQLPELDVQYSFSNLSKTHLIYRIVYLVFSSYGKREGVEGYFLNSSSLQQFYTDFFDVGVALKWLDTRSRAAGARSYVEGNLFTYSADGIKGEYSLSLSEGVDLISYLLSAGMLTDQIYRDLDKKWKCHLSSHLDFRQEPKLERHCVLDYLTEALADNLSFAPNLQEWIKSLSEKEKEAYSRLLLKAAYSFVSSEEDWVEKSELSTLSVVILYSESVLTRYDEDENGVLSDVEVDEAFPVFKEFINSLAKNLQGSQEDFDINRVRAIYEFILYFRRAPETPLDKFKIYWNSSEEPSWEVQSDRMALTEAFSVIINRLLNLSAASPSSRPSQ